MKKRALALIGISVVTFVVITALRGYESILLFVGDFTDAEVTSYVQEAPGVVREGDWAMEYRYTDTAGKSYTGKTTFAPKKRPSGSGSVRVRYLTFAPSISRPVGNISGSGLDGYLMSAWSLFLGLRALARLRAHSLNP